MAVWYFEAARSKVMGNINNQHFFNWNMHCIALNCFWHFWERLLGEVERRGEGKGCHFWRKSTANWYLVFLRLLWWRLPDPHQKSIERGEKSESKIAELPLTQEPKKFAPCTVQDCRCWAEISKTLFLLLKPVPPIVHLSSSWSQVTKSKKLYYTQEFSNFLFSFMKMYTKLHTLLFPIESVLHRTQPDFIVVCTV